MRKKLVTAFSAALAMALLLTLGGCSRCEVSTGTEEAPVVNTDPVTDSLEPPSITGTWQTASMGYADDGTMYPEYYVQFTNSDILYGHLKNGQFVLDHSDKIICLEATAAEGVRVQAEASNGIQYTYQTCESDNDVLEYYETWREEDFPEMYRGGASLSRSS